MKLIYHVHIQSNYTLFKKMYENGCHRRPFDLYTTTEPFENIRFKTFHVYMTRKQWEKIQSMRGFRTLDQWREHNRQIRECGDLCRQFEKQTFANL